MSGRFFISLLGMLFVAWQATAQQSNDNAVVIDCEKAEFAYLEKNTDEALIFLKRCRQQLPDYLPALTLLGKIQSEYGRHELAVDTFQQALEQGADAELFANEWARSLIAARKFTVLATFTGYSSFTPAMRINWLTHRALACLEIDDENCARESYSALQVLGEEVTAALGFAELAMRNKDWDSADKQLAVAASLARNDIRVLLASGRLALNLKQYDRALSLVDKASVLAPQDPLVLRIMADIYLAAEQEDAAADTLDLILSLTPDDPFALLVSNSIEPNERYAEILSSYRVRLEQINKAAQTDNQALYYLEGFIAYQDGSYEQALKAFLHLVKERAYYPQTLSLLAKTYIGLQLPQQAISVLEPEQDLLLSDAPDTMALLIELFIEDGKTFKALPSWRSFAQRYPERLDTGLLEVKILFGRGMQERAMERLSALEQQFPDSEVVARVYAVALSYAGRYQDALAIVESQFSTTAHSGPWFNFKGTLHMMLNKPESAREAFEQALLDNTALLPAKVNLAWLDFRQGRTVDALSDIKQLATQYPGLLSLQQMYAGMLLSAGQVEEAQALYETLYKKDSSARNVIETLITLYQAEGNTRESIAMLGRLIELEFDTAKNLVRRAQLYVTQQELKRADLDLYKALPLSDGNPALLIGIANVSMQTCNERLAIKTLQQAVRLAPDDPLPFIKLVEVHLNQSQAAEAAKLLDGQSAFSRLPELWLLKGRLSEQLGEATTASEHYHRAIKLDPTFDLAYAKLYALTRVNIGKQSFEQVLQARIKAEPTVVFSRSLLGQYFYYEQRFEEAAPEYEYLYSHTAEDSKKAGYARRLAQIYFHFDTPKAIEFVQIAAQLNANDPFIPSLKGWALVQTGDHQGGVKLLREAFTLNGQNADTQYFLAYTLAELGMREEARKVLTPLIENRSATTYTQAVQALHQRLNK